MPSANNDVLIEYSQVDTSTSTSVWSESKQTSTLTNKTNNSVQNEDGVSDIFHNSSTETILNKHCKQTDDFQIECVTDKYNPVVNQNIKVVLAGDKSFKNMKLNSSFPDKCLKIAPHNTNINELTETAKFFVDKMHRNMEYVVLQVSHHDCTQGKTELIKQTISNFSSQLFSQNVNLVISGPIPYPSLANSAYSRACTINNWLIDFSTDNDILFIDNLTSLSRNKYVFKENGYELNPTGCEMIGKVIFETLLALSQR